MFLASNKKRKSSDLEGTPNPKLGQKQNGAKTPKSGLKLQTPKSGLKMQTPKANLKPGTPKSNEKKNTPKNGARKSLAVNGSPKVEKISNEEKVAVKVEAVANAPANKNRKRSLSETGVESAAKTTKLEKFAGTASLTSDKKENRSARRHQQFKDKKKTLSKDNKNKIKEKILGGDIEALREIQSKLDVLTAKPVSERTKSARRKIRKLQSWLKIKTNKGGDSNNASTIDAKVQKQKAGQKKNKQQIKKELEVSAGTKKSQVAVKKESKLADDASGESDEEESNEEGDFEMKSAGSEEEGGSDEEESDVDEEDSDNEVKPEFVVDAKGQKPNKKPANNKPQNKGKAFGKPGNNKFAGRQRKGPQKK